MIKIIDYTTAYTHRAAGWVQDSSSFDNLHRFVSAFSHHSLHRSELIEKIDRLVQVDLANKFREMLDQEPISITYQHIVGTAPTGSRRENTNCNGIGQAALTGQVREFQGDWPTNNFLRWAEALQLIQHHPTTDTYTITDIGEQYAQSSNLTAQYEVIKQQLITYPPAIRVLTLIGETEQTKFSLGEMLGFVGEKGFTNISEKLFVDMYLSSEPPTRSALKSDYEGSSDKYARQICSWLITLGFVQPGTKQIIRGNETLRLRTYNLTANGVEFLRKAKINTHRFVPFGMLSMEGSSSELICKRRALILKLLSESPRTISEIESYQSQQGITTNSSDLRDDIMSLNNMGLDIESVGADAYRLKNIIDGLNIPRRITPTTLSDVLTIKERLRSELQHIDHSLLVLMDFAYGSNSTSRLFETYVARVYEQIYPLTHLLGGSNKPDIVVCTSECVVIIDAKAYKEGFSLPVSERDKMVRYIEEYKRKDGIWYETIKPLIESEQPAFQFISTKFIGNTERGLADITHRTDVYGSLISAESLLRMVDQAIKEGTELDISKLISNRVIS